MPNNRFVRNKIGQVFDEKSKARREQIESTVQKTPISSRLPSECSAPKIKNGLLMIREILFTVTRDHSEHIYIYIYSLKL